jgi:DNA helicase HerA-like ATPase
MTDPVGTIISTDDTPTPEEFFFVLHEPVKKEQFIAFDTDEGRAIARVANVRKTNQYFMQAESVSEYAKDGGTIEDHLPTADWEYLVGEGRILGVYDSADNNRIKRPSFPPSPGTDVAVAETDRLADFLGVADDGITIGDVKFQDLSASLDLTKLYQKHVAILAQSGAGKSYLASVMLEELLDRDAQDGQLATVVIDPHGEYAGFAKDSTYMGRVKVYGDDAISIGVPDLHSGSFDHYFGDVSAAQRREMEKILSDMQGEDHGAYGLDALLRAVEEADMKQSTKNVWLDRLNKMQYMGLFREYDSPALDKVEPGTMLVLDLSDIVNKQKKQIIAAYFTNKLFKARRKSTIPPFFLLVEEAHNFIPEGVSSSDAPARSVITKIAREGRKFHACLGLISQRPAKLAQTALSQCNTNIILRVTNPYDLDRIKKGSEGITGDLVDNTIPGLRVGECIVVGEAVNYPMFVDVRERRSEEFETGKDLTTVCQEYADQQAQAEDDIEAFM